MKKYTYPLVLSSFIILLFSSCATPRLEMGEQSNPIRDISNFQDCFTIMEKMFKRPLPLKEGLNFSNVKDLDELESLYGNSSFIDTQRNSSNQKILDVNKKTRELFKAPLRTDTPDGFTNYATKEELDLIYNDAANEKVHINHSCYDPKGTVGFCFGRATIVHMEALIRGMNPDSIRKIWIVGEMQGGWGHHVATMIKGKDGWNVLDPNLGRVVTIEEWIKAYEPYKLKTAKQELMLFVSRADRFGPYSSQNYTGVDLFNTTTTHYERSEDFYRGYFTDYFESLDKERKEVKKFPVRK